MSSATKPVEQKARELLADEEESDGFTEYAAWLRAGCPAHERFSERDRKDLEANTSFRAIIAALHTDGERIRREAFEEAASAVVTMKRQVHVPKHWDRGQFDSVLDMLENDIRSLSTPSKGVG